MSYILTIIEWDYSYLVCEEYPEYYEDEDYINYMGEFYFKVNEICLYNDYNIFMVAPNDRDVYNSILIYLNPSDISWNK